MWRSKHVRLCFTTSSHGMMVCWVFSEHHNSWVIMSWRIIHIFYVLPPKGKNNGDGPVSSGAFQHNSIGLWDGLEPTVVDTKMDFIILWLEYSLPMTSSLLGPVAWTTNFTVRKFTYPAYEMSSALKFTPVRSSAACMNTYSVTPKEKTYETHFS